MNNDTIFSRQNSSANAGHHKAHRQSAVSACIHSLYRYLRPYGTLDAGQAKRVSDATARERGEFLIRSIRDLARVPDASGTTYRLRDVKNFGPKHVRRLAAIWEERGYSAGVIQKYFSYLRTLTIWIDKRGMIGDAGLYLKDPKRAKRIRIATEDKSWSAQGVDVEALIATVFADDLHVGVCLMLQSAFCLRAREGWLLRANKALNDDRTILHITEGAKNGLSREFPITENGQLEVLDLAASLASPVTGSQIPARYTFTGWCNHFYYICRKHGIARKKKVVTHGLRHEGANDDYEELAGFPSPVRAGTVPFNFDKLKDHIARLEISKRLGHGRKQVSSAYLGSFLKPRNVDTTDTARASRETPLAEETQTNSDRTLILLD